MSFLEAPGDLAEVPLAAVLIEVLNQAATGVLTIEHGGGASRVFFRGGVPVGAQTFAGFRPLGQALLAEGLIDVAALGQSLAEMARTGRPQGELLIEMGAVKREHVDRALSEQQAAYLSAVAALEAGRFSFDRASPVPAWTESIRIRPLKAIVEALEKPQATPLVVAALQPASAAPVALASGYRQLAAGFDWSAAESALVDRLEAPTALDAFFAEPAVPPERARAILAALLLLGLASAGRADQLETMPPGVVLDLADLAGLPLQEEQPSCPSEPARDAHRPGGGDVPPRARLDTSTTMVIPPQPVQAPDGPCAPAPVRRRSDPEEARRRRQRLLQRAMQNMGVGPLSGQAPQAPASRPAAEPSPAARSAPTAADEQLRRALAAAMPRATSSDFFERLGLPRDATRDQVKASYIQLAKQFHPDRFASPSLADLAPQVKDLFSAVNEAYELLSDDRKRTAYAARSAAGGGVPTGDRDERAAAVDFQKAEACTRTRDFAKARGFYEAALRADPSPGYQAAYAAALLQDPRGDRAKAKELAEAALREPGCDRAAYVLALLARDEGDEAQAELMLRRALKVNPRNLEADRELRVLQARRSSKGGPPRRK